MSITANCPRCDVTITAPDEDDLVRQVQEHTRTKHGLTHTLPAKHVLAMLRKQELATPPSEPDR